MKNTIKMYTGFFPGFYGTCLEECGHVLDEDGELDENSMMEFEDQKARACELGIEWHNELFKELGIDFVCIDAKILSPKYYNYSNDNMLLTIETSDNEFSLKRVTDTGCMETLELYEVLNFSEEKIKDYEELFCTYILERF